MRLLRRGLEGLPPTKVQKIIRIVRRVFLYILILTFGLFFVQYGCWRVPEGYTAMEPEFPPGSLIFYDRLFRWHYGVWPAFPAPNQGLLRGCAVLFKAKTEDGREVMGLSRVVGMPGDIVFFHKEGIEINEKFYPHPHNREGYIKIPEDHFFLLNDNPTAPFLDSRTFGPIPIENIIARVFTRLMGVVEAF